MSKYPTYLNLHSCLNGYKKEKIIEPADFVCSCGYPGSTNDLSLVLPLSEGLLEPGDFVTWGTSEYGGRIMRRDINIRRKTVKYSGKSWWGVFGDYVIEIGTRDRTLSLRPDSTYPGGQAQIGGSVGGTAYPNNGVVPLLHYDFEHFNLPFEAVLDEPAEIATGNVRTITVPLGTTLLDLISLTREKNSQTFKVEYSTTPGKIFDFHLRNIRSVQFNITDDDDMGDIVISDDFRLTEKFDNSTVHYLANDGTYKSKSNVMSSGWPSDMKYDGVLQYSLWDPNDDSNAVNQARLKALRDEPLSNDVSTEFSKIYDEGWDVATVGDYIDIVYRSRNYHRAQRLIGKTFRLKNGIPRLKYSLGGYYDNNA